MNILYKNTWKPHGCKNYISLYRFRLYNISKAMMRLYNMFRYINIISKGYLGRIAVLLKWREACPKSSHYAAYTRYWTGTSFVQIKVCHLFQNKQLSKAIINHPRNSLQLSDNDKISKLTNLYWRNVFFYAGKFVGGLFKHNVGEISVVSQSRALNLVMWRDRVIQPTTPSLRRRGHSWLQFNVQENGCMKCQ